MFDMNLKTIKIVYFDSFMKSIYEIQILNSYTRRILIKSLIIVFSEYEALKISVIIKYKSFNGELSIFELKNSSLPRRCQKLTNTWSPTYRDHFLINRFKLILEDLQLIACMKKILH